MNNRKWDRHYKQGNLLRTVTILRVLMYAVYNTQLDTVVRRLLKVSDTRQALNHRNKWIISCRFKIHAASIDLSHETRYDYYMKGGGSNSKGY